LVCLLSIEVSEAATLGGKPVEGGGTVEIRFPVAKSFQDLAAEGGNPRVDTGRAVLMFPPGFDPARRWPILVVTSTSDFNRTSVMDAEWYRRPATAEGWVVLASDATISPRIDSTQWRLAMLAAALVIGVAWWLSAADRPAAPSAEEQGVRAACEAYVKAVNAGDASAVAKLWAAFKEHIRENHSGDVKTSEPT
jgi:hypothetical protein